MLPTVRELGIGYVAYSPLGRGFLTGQIKSPDDFADDDFRKHHPRFQGENFDEEHRAGPRGRGDGQGQGLHHRAAGAGLGAGAGRGRGADPRHQARQISRRQYRRARASSSATTDLKRLDEILPPGAAAGRALSRAGHGDGQPLALVDQAHAGDPGLGLLKLGDIDFGHLESAAAEE